MTRPAEDPEVLQLLDAWSTFDLGLRLGEGFQQTKWEALQQALKRCKEVWSERDHLPRPAMSALVDMFAATEACAGIYQDGQRKQIQDLAYALQELIQDCIWTPDMDQGT